MDVSGPYRTPISPAARRVEEAGLVTFSSGPDHVLVLTLEGGLRTTADLRPALPLVLRGRV